MKKEIEHIKVLDNIGTSGQIAKLCEVSSQAVSMWKQAGKIPKAWYKYLREIRPEAFK